MVVKEVEIRQYPDFFTSYVMDALRHVIWLPFLLLNLHIDVQGQEWERELEQDGISVYTRNVQGKAYKEFKATTIVNTSLHSLLALFKSVDQMPEWLTQCEETKLISSEHFWHQLSYHEVKVPVLRNRDMVLEMNISQDTIMNTLRIDIQGKPSLYPKQSRKIRVEDIHGYWLCKPLEDGSMYIEYSMYLDPAGIIPPWLYNKRIKNDPYETLLNLQQRVKRKELKLAFYPQVAQLTNQQQLIMR